MTPFDRSFGCGSVVFFHAVIDSPESLPIIKYYFATGAPFALMTIVEGNRKGQNHLMRFPVVPLLLTQIASFGATFPLSCLALVISGGVERARQFDARSFSRLQAESIAFAMTMGVVLPSLAVFIFDHPIVTWFWQLYPIYVSIFQNLYLRSPSPSTPSGYSTIRLLYITTFLASAFTHLNLVWNHRDSLSSVVQLLFPSTQIPDPTLNIDLQTLHILNWDFTLGYLAACIALLWYAENLRQIIMALVWYGVATPLLGLGTAFMGVAMWRDGILW